MKKETAVFGGGCFWCTEAVFKELKGVLVVESGYAGGETDAPTYGKVSTGKTGHAEVIKIDFDPSVISYRDLLTVFFATHDPTTPNRQGADVGSQYRSIILYSSPEEKQEAEDFIKELADPKSAPLVTEVRPLGKFFPAEEYHRDYYENHKREPYCEVVISPKIEKLKERFAELLKK